MSQSKTAERRRFSRVSFDGTVLLNQGPHHWRCELLDVSLRGALVVLPAGAAPDPALPLTLKLALDLNHQVLMQCRLAHQAGQQLGLECQRIDVDSVANLRRLIELNTGDAEAAERELGLLGSAAGVE